MRNVYLDLEIKDKKIEEIFKRLEAAKEEIWKCYCELEEALVVKIVPADGSGRDEENQGA